MISLHPWTKKKKKKKEKKKEKKKKEVSQIYFSGNIKYIPVQLFA